MRAPRFHGRRGSVLLPLVAGMLVLLLTGTALSELYGAQRMRSVLAVEAAQARWAAEAGLWHAAFDDAEIATPVDFAGCTYTVTKTGDLYTSTADRGQAQQVVSFTFTAATGSSGSTTSSTPIAHWPLDESSGTTATEQIAGNDGTLVNGVGPGASGPPGGGTAMQFDGSNDYVTAPHASAYLLAEGTIQLWFRPDDTSGTQGLFSKDSTSYDTGGHVMMRMVGDDLEVRFQSTSTSYYVRENNVLSAGTWHHAAFTFGPGGMALYLDGTLVDTDPYTGGTGTTSGGSGNAEPIVLGANSWKSGDLAATPLEHYYDGRIAAVAIYDTALSATDIQALHTAGGAL